MPSFLNKVFGYRKHDDKEAVRPTREPSDGTLLDGKYEAIPPVLPSSFPEAQSAKDSDRDVGFSLFRPRTRGTSQKPAKRHPEDAPHLTLQLPVPKANLDSPSLGAVFEADPDSQIVLDDAIIAAKRLSPLELLILIRTCAQAITERGLDTLGIMHPHWSSASPDAQRKLISLFIHSLSQNQITTLSPAPTSSTSPFENELLYTRSPHDVAAVLRWGIRHLSLEGGHFGKDGTDWEWYNAFFLAERDASYPPKAFSELLLPRLPIPHIELLTMTLSLISSFASHAEANGISGSKLSKCLGLWLLVATRAEQPDDWNRFYARWERAGRILEHLFLAHLREESLRQRLPTRLQELVKHYPYSKESSATDDGLLSRPRFSTRQYDALFVRVEALLTHGVEQPKQHPIQLLLEAFQLPIDNPSGDEHIALWNALKTIAFEGTNVSDPGPQFTRIFVDETIHLLSLIPPDDNIPTSPTCLISPISKVMPRKRSSLSKGAERAFGKSNAENGSTPVSPTSPSSAMITDWAQFTLSGFGDTQTAQPLAALLSQDDDLEVTQPTSRKSSRQRGKSRSRRRSEDRVPSNTSRSSRPEPSIVETKLASVHVVQIDEAFIDFWSDAIVDPVSTNWPTFVVCGLKQVPSAEQPIRWLVIEQAYGRQQLQPSRAPSPEGHRGRSPRPSFRSDISGFRINSVFSSARKRLSLFSKSATDLASRKSGGRTPVAGELGQVLAEEEPTSPSTPSTLGRHTTGSIAVRATVTSGATTNIADQLNADEISTAPIVGVPPALRGESNPFQATVKAPSIEPAPQPGAGYSGSSELPRSSVRELDVAVSVGQGPPRTLDGINPKVNNLADPVMKIVPLAADTSTSSQSTQGAYDPTVLASGPVSSTENPVLEPVQTQVTRVDVAAEADDRLVTPIFAQQVNGDGYLHTESTGRLSSVVRVGDADNGSREDMEDVAMTSSPDTVAVVAAIPLAQPEAVAGVDVKAPESAIEESRVELSRNASADPAAAFTVESDSQHEVDNPSPVYTTEVIATETGTQLEPRPATSVVDEIEEAKDVAELSEIPTPAPEHVALVEETPGQEVPVDVCERAGVAQVPAAKPKVVDDAASQPVAAELEIILKAEASSSVEAPLIGEVFPAVATSARVVAAETEHAADQVPVLAMEEALPHVQDTLVRPTEAILVEALPAPGVEVDISAAIVSTLRQPEDVALAELETPVASESFVHEDCIVEAHDKRASTPVPEHIALVGDTLSTEIVAESREVVEVALAISPESEEVPDEARDPVVEVVVEAKTPSAVPLPLAEEAQPSSEGELPTQVRGNLATGALSTGANSEAATAALATIDEAIAVKVEANSTPDSPTDDANPHAPASENIPVEDTLEIAAEDSGPVYGVPSTITDPEPITEEAQVLAKVTAPSAGGPVAIAVVAQDVQARVQIEQPSSEFTQSADEATNAPIVAVPIPEEATVVKVEAQVESRAVHPTVGIVDGDPAEVGDSVEEMRVIVNTSEPEALAVEPELVEAANAPALVIKDVQASTEPNEFSVVVEMSEEVVIIQSEAPLDDLTKANEL